MPNGLCGVISVEFAEGKEQAAKWLDALELVSLEVHVADIRTCVASCNSTHRQLTDEELQQAGISPGLVRLSCGIENVNDLLADLQQAFDKLEDNSCRFSA